MADVLSDIQDYIHAYGFAESGVDLFVNYLPSDVENGVLLLNPVIGFLEEPTIPGLYKGRFSLVVRSNNHADTYDRAKTLKDLLGSIRGQYLNFHYIYSCKAVADPSIFPISEGGFREGLVSFDLIYRE